MSRPSKQTLLFLSVLIVIKLHHIDQYFPVSESVWWY